MLTIDNLHECKALLEHSSDIIGVVDDSGEIKHHSGPTEQVLGYEAEELVGTDAFEYMHSEDQERVLETFQEAIGSPGVVTDRVEYRFKHGNGSWIWLESRATNHKETSLGGYVINSREISQRKEWEHQLQKRNEELEALNRLVRHDIRNDMSIVLGWMEILEEHVEPSGEEYLQKVITSGNHIVELTEIARDYVSTLTSEDTIEQKPTDLYSVLHAELDLRREAFPQAEFVIQDEIPSVTVQANELLASVFRNILNNAVQHNDKETPVVNVGCEVEQETVSVRIADNGPGIPDDHKEEIFGKQERGLDSPGTGIGLYLVQRLVDQYGGSIRVEDNNPEGAVFHIELPKAT